MNNHLDLDQANSGFEPIGEQFGYEQRHGIQEGCGATPSPEKNSARRAL